ncbi:hypothetical protein XI05_10235 [Bradyrhizobium sp. CCBAU 11357]|nr:hypothetical protein [Bradyrhizobium sp. CCBAU 11357]
MFKQTCVGQVSSALILNRRRENGTFELGRGRLMHRAITHDTKFADAGRSGNAGAQVDGLDSVEELVSVISRPSIPFGAFLYGGTTIVGRTQVSPPLTSTLRPHYLVSRDDEGLGGYVVIDRALLLGAHQGRMFGRPLIFDHGVGRIFPCDLNEFLSHPIRFFRWAGRRVLASSG